MAEKKKLSKGLKKPKKIVPTKPLLGDQYKMH